MKAKSSKVLLPIALDSATVLRPNFDSFAGFATSERCAHAEISHRAHSIWESAGRPDNCQLAHWLEAEAEVLGQV